MTPTVLDPGLLDKIADRTGKPVKYVREQISRRAARLTVSSEAAQILWAKELGIGTSLALRKLSPHMQQQVRENLPVSFAARTRASGRETVKSRSSKRDRSSSADPLALAVDYLLLDDELKSRCKDLLLKKRHSDRAIREATTVLETRIRRLSGSKERSPEALVNKAVNSDPSKALLVVSTEPSEQQGIHSICRGIVLTFRHKAHHHLDDKVTREEALKFCSFIDVVLAILGRADRPKGSTNP